LNNVPSQVRTTVVPEVPSARRSDVRRFSAVLINFWRFQRRYAPKPHRIPGSGLGTEHYLKSALVRGSDADSQELPSALRAGNLFQDLRGLGFRESRFRVL